MVEVSEPDGVLVDRAIRSLKLTMALIDADPTARGAKDMIEAWYGRGLENDIVRWLRNPREKKWLRDRFVMKLSEVWK